jgi:hypothetical protein
VEALFPKPVLKKMNLSASDANKRIEFLEKEIRSKAAFYFNYQLPDPLSKREEEKCVPYSFERYKLTPEQLQTGTVSDWDTPYNSSTFPNYDLRAKIAPTYFAGSINFAGHFTVVSWECGRKCQEHAVVDTKTGRIIKTGLRSQYGADFKLNSLVLVLNPYSTMLEPAPGTATQFYILDEHDTRPVLKLVCSYTEPGKTVSPVTTTISGDSDSESLTTSTDSLDLPATQGGKRYMGKSKEQCATMLIKCEANEQVFIDEEGCGCTSGIN